MVRFPLRKISLLALWRKDDDVKAGGQREGCPHGRNSGPALSQGEAHPSLVTVAARDGVKVPIAALDSWTDVMPSERRKAREQL